MTAQALGGTAIDVWRAWRSEGYLMGTSCYARSPSVGEVCFGAVHGEKVDKLHVVVQAHAVRRATEAEEDRVWEELLSGRLHIYRRRNAPLSGASMAPTATLHESSGTPIKSGLDE